MWTISVAWEFFYQKKAEGIRSKENTPFLKYFSYSNRLIVFLTTVIADDSPAFVPAQHAYAHDEKRGCHQRNEF